MTNKTPAKPSIGIVLRVALMVSGMFGPLARPHLKRRLAKGKEDPNRWREKLGETDAKRPDGPLIWLHGVGVGEVMALRGLIQHLAHERPELHFLVTSSARSSGTVFSHNLPPRTQHQYLPLDLPGPVARFLDFWRPDLAVWSDQEVWPRMAVTLARRGIAQAYVAARITKKSAKTKSGFGDGYGNLYRLLDLRHAQDDRTADAMRRLMGDDSTVHVTGSIKAAGAPLAHDPDVTDAFAKITTLRRTWLVASSHPADEAVALAAHALIRKTDPDALLIVAPRDICRADEIAKSSQSQGMTVAKRSDTLHPNDDIAVYIADTYGELGTWYRAAPIAMIGGTFDTIEGHNPWEPAALDTAILHGPHVANFALDFEALSAAKGCLLTPDVQAVARAVLDANTLDLIDGARTARTKMAQGAAHITHDLLALMDD